MKKQEKDNQYIKDIIKKVKDYYACVISVITFLGVIISNILKFIEHLTSEAYFSYFGLNHNLYMYSDRSFIYNLCISILLMFAIYSVFYCFKQLRDNKNLGKIFLQENFWNIILILISNTYMIIIVSEKTNNSSLILNLIFLIIFEFIASLFIFRKEKEIDYTDEQIKKKIINYIKIFPFLILLLIILHTNKVYLNLNLLKDYNIINNNKVIVYSTNDYYLTLDCDINGNELIIYKGEQEKIDNNNVKSELKKFDKVVMK